GQLGKLLGEVFVLDVEHFDPKLRPKLAELLDQVAHLLDHQVLRRAVQSIGFFLVLAERFAALIDDDQRLALELPELVAYVPWQAELWCVRLRIVRPVEAKVMAERIHVDAGEQDNSEAYLDESIEPERTAASGDYGQGNEQFDNEENDR